MTTFRGVLGGNWSYDPAKRLGKPGGFAVVFLGRDEANGQAVAVKVIPTVLPDGRALDPRLRQREIEIANKIRSGGTTEFLIPILDHADVGGDLLLVMPRADKSLDEIGTPTDAETLQIIREITAGLRELHERGIIHRDLKPPNILRHEDRWVLADFGIARDTEIGTGDPTFVGWGTFDYMAPELWELRSPTVKTDLYALGCLGYELLAGSPPFAGRDPDGCRNGHMHEMPRPLERGNPQLRSLIQRLLNKDPATRPQDARDVHERLGRIAVPLSVSQQELQALAVVHAMERAALSVRAAEARQAADVRDTLIRQSVADLKQVCEEALELILAALPGAVLKEQGRDYRDSTFLIRHEDAYLKVFLWEDPVAADGDDPILIGGQVNGGNRRHRGEIPLANIVSELRDGRIEWFLLRFRASGFGRYRSPVDLDIEHGFPQEVFRRERFRMLHPAVHIWSMNRQPLSAETFLTLFQAALALPG